MTDWNGKVVVSEYVEAGASSVELENTLSEDNYLSAASGTTSDITVDAFGNAEFATAPSKDTTYKPAVSIPATNYNTMTLEEVNGEAPSGTPTLFQAGAVLSFEGAATDADLYYQIFKGNEALAGTAPVLGVASTGKATGTYTVSEADAETAPTFSLRTLARLEINGDAVANVAANSDYFVIDPTGVDAFVSADLVSTEKKYVVVTGSKADGNAVTIGTGSVWNGVSNDPAGKITGTDAMKTTNAVEGTISLVSAVELDLDSVSAVYNLKSARLNNVSVTGGYIAVGAQMTVTADTPAGGSSFTVTATPDTVTITPTVGRDGSGYDKTASFTVPTNVTKIEVAYGA